MKLSAALILRSFLIWLLFAIMAPINGLVREFLISPYVGSFAGHAISSVSLALIIGLIIYAIFSWMRISSRREAWLTGGLWVVLTVLFEFGLGRATGVAWSVLLEDYNIFMGHLWLLVLVTELIVPVVLVGRKK